MTAEEFCDLVNRRLELRNSAIPISVSAEMEEFSPDVRLVAVAEVPDRDTGFLRRIHTSRYIDSHRLERGGAHYANHTLREFLTGIFVHECLEAVHIDGERVWDPHG